MTLKKHDYKEYIAIKKLIEAIEAVDDIPEHFYDNAVDQAEAEYFHYIDKLFAATQRSSFRFQ